MRGMVEVKPTRDDDAGVMPIQRLLTEMGKSNEELMNAGVLLDGKGSHVNLQGARVRSSRRKLTVIDGPFAETKELFAGC